MASILTIILVLSALGFPTLMLTITYPFSKKAALFWSNYITNRTARIFFALLKTYRNFNFIQDKKSKENLPEQFMVISNHQSLLDIVVYLCFFHGHKVRFVAKDALASAPMVGKMLRSQQHCMIPRKGNVSKAMHEIEKLSVRAKEDSSIIPVIYPEGTRSRDGNVGKFYSAGFRKLSDSCGLPVVTCCLDGGWKLSDVKQFFTALNNGSYRVKVLKVYEPPKNKQEIAELLDESKELIADQLTKWRSLDAGSTEV